MSAARGEIVAAAVVAAALVALGLVFGSAGPKEDDPRPSTLVDSRNGLRALFLLLEEVGAKPRRAQSAPAPSDAKDHTLVIAAPTQVATRRETKAIADWVRAGGRLVVVAGPAKLDAPALAAPLLKAFGVAATRAWEATGHDLKFADEKLEEGLARMDWRVAWSLVVVPDETMKDAGTPEELVKRSSQVLVLRETFGAGEVLVIGDARLLDNDSLGRGDNAVLAVRLLLARGSDEGRIVFDEFHHGFQSGDGPGDSTAAMTSMLVHTWPGRAVLMLLLAGLTALLGAAVRFGAPETEKPPPRRALTEHAEALGRLFETARARTEALQILAAGARRVVGARTGIPAALPAEEFTQRLSSSPAPGASELAAAMDNAENSGPVGDSHLADAARELAVAQRRFLHGGD